MSQVLTKKDQKVLPTFILGDAMKNFLFLFTLFVLVTTSLAFDKQLYQVFALAKAFYLKFFLAVSIILWSALNLFAYFSGAKAPKMFQLKNPFQEKNPLILPLLFLGALSLLSTIFSIDPWMSLVGVYERGFGLQGLLTCLIAFFILLQTRPETHALSLILLFIYISSLISALYGISQFFGWDPLGFLNTPYQNVYSLTGNPNFLGNLLALTFPLSFWAFYSSKNKVSQIFSVLGVIILVLGIFFSKTRGAWFATIGSTLTMLILFLLYFRNSPQNKEGPSVFSSFFSSVIPWSLALFLLFFFFNSWFIYLYEKDQNFLKIPLVLFIIILPFLFYLGGLIKISPKLNLLLIILIFPLTLGLTLFLYKNFLTQSDRVAAYFEMFNVHNSIRYFLWRDSFQIIKNNFFLGIGPETYRKVFLPFKSFELAFISPQEHDNPHNTLLSQWAALGMGGVVAFFWPLILILKRNYLLLKNNEISLQHKVLALTFLGTILSYLLWGISGFDTLVTTPILIALFAANGIFFQKISELSPSSSERQKESWPSLSSSLFSQFNLRKAPPLFSLLAFLGISSAASWSAYTTYQHREAEKNAQQAFSLHYKVSASLQRSSVSETLYLLKSSRDLLERALTFNPQESYYHVRLAETLLNQARVESNTLVRQDYLDLHQKHLNLALEHTWMPEMVYNEELRRNIQLKDLSSSLKTIDKILKITPYSIPVRSTLGQLIYLNAPWRTDKALSEKLQENSLVLLKLKPLHQEARLVLFEVYWHQGNERLAREQIQFFEQNHPQEHAKINYFKEKLSRLEKRLPAGDLSR